MQALTEAMQGEIYTIKWLFGVPEVLNFMADCQIKEGSVIQVMKKYRDCLIISAGERRIALSREVADRIKV
ncbi:FeoA domain-containing protein [Bariatricus sp. SGI.154]|uniref:FeoA domain-containing protein n=1 Tax=Bariatricus sp. SGI.154 TaxID=3420549 RepID=UPI003D0926AA